jgi:putative nucleotidyltransferase with HDIG domain
MKNDLIKWIPEFQSIKDSGLRTLTLKVWEEAMARGGWSVSDLLEMPFTLLIPNRGVSLIEHTRAVTLTAMKIAGVLKEEYKEKISIDLDVLLSGVLLHDVGKLFEYKKEGGKFLKSREGELLRHPISGAAFAFKYGLPQEVIHIIAAHSKEGDGSRRTIEAVIVNHADFVNFDVFRD